MAEPVTAAGPAVLALSPQYSMQQDFGRQERRWNYLRDIPRERHRSAQYLFNLARRQPSARLRLKGRLAAAALARRPEDAALLSYAGVLEDLQGHRDAALALHARAARTGYGLARLRYALSLMRAGLTDEAAVAAQDAMTGLPPAAIPFELIAVAEARSAPATALDALLRLPHIKSLSPAFAVLSALAGPAPLRWLLARGGAAFAPRLVRTVLSDRRFMAHHLWISDWD